MAENEPDVEVIAGTTFPFNERGITGDSLNAWMPNSMRGDLRNFDELAPVEHYGEYFQRKDQQYTEAGKPGLFQGIMEKSNPEGVAEFDKLVDEFNVDLPRIKEERDGEAVQEFFRRAGELTK